MAFLQIKYREKPYGTRKSKVLLNMRDEGMSLTEMGWGIPASTPRAVTPYKEGGNSVA